MTEPELIDILSERQWNRMTRSGVTWADLTEHDRRASRAIVAPILADLRAESQTPWMIASALSLERVLNSEPSRDEAAYDEAQIRRGMRDDQ